MEEGDRVICTEDEGTFSGPSKGHKGVVVKKEGYGRFLIKFEKSGTHSVPEEKLAKI